MNKFKKIFEDLTDEEEIYTDTEDDTAIENDDELEDTDTDDITVGSIVKIIDISSFIPEDLELTEEEFDALTAKVEADESAVVFDIDDEDETKTDIVFSDGFEVFNFPKIALEKNINIPN